nr:FUSC family protein [Pseudonocardia acidicola]
MTAWLRRRDPGLAITRRAIRVGAAACAAFFLGRYGLGSPTVATYAVFGVIALGALSDVSGPPRQRTRTLLGCFAAGAVLVTLGTLLAVNTWAAVAGMLVVGFVVAFAAAGGPRVTGVASGVHLFYILPCFPPYQPETLPQRLLGLAIGVGLLAVADRVLLPDPGPPGFRTRLAEVADRVAAFLSALLDEPTGTPRWADALERRREDARPFIEKLRLGGLPLAERPAGPSARDRGLTQAAQALRALHDGLGAIVGAVASREPAPAPELVAEVRATLGVVAASLDQVRAALRDVGPPPELAAVDAAIVADDDRRIRRLSTTDRAADLLPGAPLRVAVQEAVLAQRTLVLAARAGLGVPEPVVAAADTAPGGQFWYVRAGPVELWWRRLRCHLTFRSVYLQNAVRLAVGLALARLVAGEFALSHGFWVLLATLSLMRTSAVATRSALAPAFLGTVVGALVAGGLLFVAGPQSVLYAVLFPIVLVGGLVAGPLFGPAVGQALFTILVAVLFAQLAPASWSLAGARVLDVVAGGLIGVLIGVAIYPRGGRGEVRREAARCLRAGADRIEQTVGLLAGGPPAGGAPEDLDGRGLLVLFDASYAQYRSEPRAGPPDPVDWLAVLGAAHRLDRGAAALQRRFPEPTPSPWPQVAVGMRAAGHEVADNYRVLADELARDMLPAPAPAAAGTPDWVTAMVRSPDRAAHPDAALRVVDAWGWLSWLLDDLRQVSGGAAPQHSPAAPRSRSGQHGLDVDVDP